MLIRKIHIFRGVLASAFLVLAVYLMVSAVSIGNPSASAGIAALLLFAFASLIIATVIWYPELARLAATPFTKFIDSIYMPGGHASRPPLDFKLARRCCNAVRFDDAIRHYQRINRYYPHELEPYERLIELHLDFRHDPAAAEKVLKRARRNLSDSKGLQLIEHMMMQAKNS